MRKSATVTLSLAFICFAWSYWTTHRYVAPLTEQKAEGIYGKCTSLHFSGSDEQIVYEAVPDVPVCYNLSFGYAVQGYHRWISPPTLHLADGTHISLPAPPSTKDWGTKIEIRVDHTNGDGSSGIDLEDDRGILLNSPVISLTAELEYPRGGGLLGGAGFSDEHSKIDVPVKAIALTPDQWKLKWREEWNKAELESVQLRASRWYIFKPSACYSYGLLALAGLFGTIKQAQTPNAGMFWMRIGLGFIAFFCLFIGAGLQLSG